MDPLPGNREIQPHFVKQHIEGWGNSIDRMGHPMSGILIGEESAQPDSEDFLPRHMRVQVCHGQHRMLVMEEKIWTTLITEEVVMRAQEEIHAHPEAYWYMNVDPACKLLPTLKSYCSIFYFPIALKVHSNGMFLSWVLGDNTHVSKAPNKWQDLIPAHHSFLSESLPPPTPLEQKIWWLDMAGGDKGLQELKGIFRCSKLFSRLRELKKIPSFTQDKRKYLEDWGKGMQNVSWMYFPQFLDYF